MRTHAACSHRRRAGLLALGMLAFAGCHVKGDEWHIAGTVRRGDGTPLAGVHVLIEWPRLGYARTEDTDAEGRWQWWWQDDSLATLAEQQQVRIRAFADGYTFAPASYDYDVPHEQLGIDFTGTPTSATLTLVFAWDDRGLVERTLVMRTADAVCIDSVRTIGR